MKHLKLVITGIVILAVITASVTFSSSYSSSNPLEFSEIMKQDSGYSAITVSGESSTTLAPDSAVMVLTINNPPADLQDAIGKYNQTVKDVTEQIRQELENYDDVTISYIQTSFDGNNYNYGRGAPASDSFTAYMTFPVKVDMEKYQNVTQDITNLGLRIDDIKISKVPIADPNIQNPKTQSVQVSIPSGTSVPSCEVTNECFMPAEITIEPGTEVIWSNDDEAAHTVTSGIPSDGPDGVFDSSLFMAGTKFSYIFDAPGEYPYFCLVHPWMTGTVIVSGDATANLGYNLEATINVRLETKPDTLENTLSSYTKTLDDLSALLEANGVSGEIPRSSININPSYYQQGTFDSYQTYSRWTVKAPLENLDSVYGILSKYGGVERMYLTQSESSIDTVRQTLTQEALDDAKQKALEIVGPMNLEIKGIKTIRVNQGYDQQRNQQIPYGGVFVLVDEWNNIRNGNISVMVDVEFEVGK